MGGGGGGARKVGTYVINCLRDISPLQEDCVIHLRDFIGKICRRGGGGGGGGGVRSSYQKMLKHLALSLVCCSSTRELGIGVIHELLTCQRYTDFISDILCGLSKFIPVLKSVCVCVCVQVYMFVCECMCACVLCVCVCENSNPQ